MIGVRPAAAPSRGLGLDWLPGEVRAELDGSELLDTYDRAVALAQAHVDAARVGAEVARPEVYRARLEVALDQVLDGREFLDAWERAGRPCA